MNVTDIGVAPDGSVYFTMGGRHTQGGVYRIVYTGEQAKPAEQTAQEKLLSWPQPQAAWSRAALAKWLKEEKVDLAKELAPVAGDPARPAAERIKRWRCCKCTASRWTTKACCYWSRTRTPRSAPRPSTRSASTTTAPTDQPLSSR